MTLKQEYIKSRNFIFSKMIFSTCMENTYGRKIYFDECDRYTTLPKLIMQMQSPNKVYDILTVKSFCEHQIEYLNRLKSASLVSLRPGAIYAYEQVVKFIKDIEQASECSGLQNRVD